MPVPASSLHYTVGPVIAVVAIVIIIGFMRWAFSQQTRQDPFAADADSSGLLEPVAQFGRSDEALALRAVLSDAGIRSTIRVPRRGGAEVLVFPVDLPRAKTLVGRG